LGSILLCPSLGLEKEDGKSRVTQQALAKRPFQDPFVEEFITRWENLNRSDVLQTLPHGAD
jgi:hypothetical protein